MAVGATGPRRLVLARVRRPWGRAGELLLELHTDWPAERFRPGGTVMLAHEGRTPVHVRVRGYRELTQRPLLALEGVEDIGAAQDWTGAWILAAEDAPDRIAGDGVLQSEVIGLPVLHADGARVGVVTGIEEGAGADHYRVEHVGGGELLLPADAPFCRIEPGRGIVLSDPPEGLLDPERAVVARPEGGPRRNRARRT